jgi:disulfide bond formation protein DsbB
MTLLTRRNLILLATLGSAAMILGAWGFQYIGGMAPCKLCYWQRYPHMTAVLIGLAALVVAGRALPLAGMLAALTTSAIGLYHAGVEKAWWEGPTDCSSADVSALSVDDLMNQIMTAPLVRCDEIPWEMFGVSMAGWNMLASLGFAAVWALAALRR